MSRLRGFIYWLITSSPLARALGRMLRLCPFDRFGPLAVPSDASPQTVTGIAFGAYEYSERYLLRRWLPGDLDVVELGASIGIVSREILQRISPERRLIAVEAIPALADLAESNIGRRFLGRRWHLLQAAVAYCSREMVTFATGLQHTAGKVAHGDDGPLQVRTTTLSDILQKFDVRDFSLVMDIEGAEHEVLQHERESLARCRCMIVELHGDSAEKDFFYRTLQEIGMKCVEQKHSVAAFLRV